jgi:hypothetical protein
MERLGVFVGILDKDYYCRGNLIMSSSSEENG